MKMMIRMKVVFIIILFWFVADFLIYTQEEEHLKENLVSFAKKNSCFTEFTL
jgi:hypothetical protein